MTFSSSHVRILLICIALLYAIASPRPAGATGWHYGVHVIKPVIVPPAVPPVVVPPPAPVVVTPAAAPAATAAPAAPAQQPSGGGGGGGINPGYFVMAGVAIFFFAVICTNERRVNPQGWFARSCKPTFMQ